jgi:outer membrane protein assembly factor BamA
MLKKKRYSKKLLMRTKNKINRFLAKLGFHKSVVTLHRKLKPRNRMSLLFKIVIKKQKQFSFEGNDFFSASKLQNIRQQPHWISDPNIFAQQILHAYHENGFWETQISYKQISKNHYKFFIREGKRVSIEEVVVKDVETNSSEKNKFFFNAILNSRFYNRSILEKCIESLTNFYVTHGFWDFTIVEQQFVKITNKKYKLLLLIKKGKQRFLKNVSLPKFPHLKKQYPHAPFNPAWLTEQRNHILSYFQKEGYWYVDAQPKLTTTDNQVSVVWNVTPGEKIVFGKILISGNSRLPFKRIMQEVRFKEGEIWDRKKLDYTRKKLKELDIFKHVEIHPKKISHYQHTKPILVTLIDDAPVIFKLRTGYFLTSKNFLLKRESTAKVGASVIIKNPFNLADKLSFDADITRFEKNVDFYYQVPGCFNNAITTRFKSYFHKYVHPLEVGKSDSAYEALQTGFLTGITKEYKPRSFWGCNIGNEWTKTKRTRGNLNLSKNMIGKTIPYFFIEPNILIDHIDDRLETKQGSLTFLSIKMMVPFENRSTTFNIFRETFREIMPIERFYLGGPFSVRGYSKDTVPPLGSTIKKHSDGSTTIEYTIQGGSSMINGNIELRIPLYKSFGCVLFQDIGVLSQSGLSGFVGKWAPTSGFGLRYNTPIGALRFDIGWKWKKNFPKDTSHAWYLTLGQVF